ncbi:metallophosphoesterase family protein [Sphingobacterium cavernae]|uniref:metallophosphoesterase family protein n=1 Tax=Sphingobacterium cavernae TaxID=2592657 RepID=UPI0012300118|nr:metallophosphoesterase [Sphingobacterium cavernae]
MMLRLSILVLINCITIQLSSAQDFKFAFFTDMHISSDSTLSLVHQRVKDTKAHVDFIMLGGDNVDIDNQNAQRMPQAIERYKGLKKIFQQEGTSFYPTIGNHDRLSSAITANSDSLFVDLFGKTYYSFEHKHVRFIVLNSVQVVNSKYAIDSVQLDWLKNLIATIPTSQPIVISTHVPFLSVYYPVLTGKYTDTDTFSNQKEVFDLFKNHNLKLVLQGHMHLYEEIKVKGTTFITAGAVSGNWWSGDYHGTKPGALIVNYSNGEFTWNYN